jgi:hypothetical protein
MDKTQLSCPDLPFVVAHIFASLSPSQSQRGVALITSPSCSARGGGDFSRRERRSLHGSDGPQRPSARHLAQERSLQDKRVGGCWSLSTRSPRIMGPRVFASPGSVHEEQVQSSSPAVCFRRTGRVSSVLLSGVTPYSSILWKAGGRLVNSSESFQKVARVESCAS